ncbi:MULTISPECIES: helix-turn-helix transcriptional regulator [unclassified Mesorhizobium]|uniref:helix-turn-helix domain-containing protein n=1 Tax=unclassified Mesorhizobium TaxID=325217 RepID=UPI00112B684B|nr:MULTISPECIES: helix-turn-helix transcriptional regulator [unclassified Mesorhizobium]TPM06788.1 helix-turn-helix transcriptional regulator [Mesorhizobium sp. B2-3-8]TPM15329.1 helix-turn-helix transcriptional regulator [Mesorhizobium sp. B2-3-7]
MAKDEGVSTNASRELIRLHREWVMEISRQLGLTPTQIAKQAGMVATTLSRIVANPDHPHALSSTTIDKIVRKFGVSPPVSPDYQAFRQAVEQTVAALHQRQALQLASPADVARAVVELADWLAKAGNGKAEQFEGVASFEVERLKAKRST